MIANAHETVILFVVSIRVAKVGHGVTLKCKNLPVALVNREGRRTYFCKYKRNHERLKFRKTLLRHLSQ